MAINKNVVEEALFQIRNLEETLQENAKGILQSTMSDEIKQLVKESLKESKKGKGVDEQDEPVTGGEAELDPETEVADDDMDADMDVDMEADADVEDVDMDVDVPAAPGDEMDVDDEETVDLTGASDDEVLRVFKAMGDEDGIVVKKEGDATYHLTDGDNEYMIQLGESEEDMDETIYEIEMDDMEDMDETYMMEDDDMMEDDYMMEQGDYGNSDDDRNEGAWWLEEDDMMEDDYMMEQGDYGNSDDDRNEGAWWLEEDDMMEDDEPVYEIEMDGDEMMEDDMDSIMEAIKKASKPKGVGIGRGPKFSYDKKPNMGGGFNDKKKEAFGKGTKAMGTGKAKFEYKEGENMNKGKNTNVKKSETKEAARTIGNGSKEGRGLRKGRMNNRNYEYNPFKLSESRINEEVESLREKNEEYKKALDVFRTKLNEVAVFNSNLAYATRLFTEHSTTKQEKINILRRFDNVESLKESKNLYRSIKNELSSGGSKGEQITESIERNVNRTVSTGSAVNLIESKTYENPQFLRMKDLMGKIK